MNKVKETAKKLFSNKKMLILMVTCVLALTCVIGGTIAWLTSKPEPIVNTFTIGDINITLDETTGTEYKMVPGNLIKKDPKVTVLANSEDCWLFVKVEESAVLDTFISYTIADGWTELEEGVYYCSVTGTPADATFAVLAGDSVTVKTTVTKEDMNSLKGENATQPTLSFTAYAVQKDNVDSAAEAWTIAKG